MSGISRCNPKHSLYKVHSFTDSLFSKPNPSIEFITENKKDSTWWITTNKGKLLHYNPASPKVNSNDFYKMPLNEQGLHPAHLNRTLFFKNRVLMFRDYGDWIIDGNTAFKPFALRTVAGSITFRNGVLINDSILYCTDFKRLWRWNINNNSVEELQFDKNFTVEKGEQPYIVYLTKGAGGKLGTLNGKAGQVM